VLAGRRAWAPAAHARRRRPARRSDADLQHGHHLVGEARGHVLAIARPAHLRAPRLRPAGMETGRTPTRGRAWGNAARASKMPPAPRYVRTSEPSRTLHTCRFLSNEPLASSWPLGEKATEYTACVCFVSAKMHAPVSASHSLRGQNRHLKGVCVGASLER